MCLWISTIILEGWNQGAVSANSIFLYISVLFDSSQNLRRSLVLTLLWREGKLFSMAHQHDMFIGGSLRFWSIRGEWLSEAPAAAPAEKPVEAPPTEAAKTEEKKEEAKPLEKKPTPKKKRKKK